MKTFYSIILIALTFSVLPQNAFAQNVTISGPLGTTFGDTETYTLHDPNGEIAPGTIEWGSDGSIQGASNSSSIDVLWDIEGHNMVELCYEDASGNQHCNSIQIIVFFVTGPLNVNLGSTDVFTLEDPTNSVEVGSIDWSSDGLIYGVRDSSSVEVFWDEEGTKTVEVCFEDVYNNSLCVITEVEVFAPSITGNATSQTGNIETYQLIDPNNLVKAGTIVWSSGGSIEGDGNSSSVDVRWDREGAQKVEVCFDDDTNNSYCLDLKVMVSTGTHISGASSAKIGETGTYTLEDPTNEVKSGTIEWSSAGDIQGNLNSSSINVLWDDEGARWVKVCYEDVNDEPHCINKKVGISGEQNVYIVGPSRPKLGDTDNYRVIDPDDQIKDGSLDWSSDGVIQGSRNNPNVDIYWDSEGENIVELCYEDTFNNTFCIIVEAVVVDVPAVTAASLNHIRTITPKRSVSAVASLANDEKAESKIYYDGLGRTKQSIDIGGGGAGEDLITHFDYDDFGRQQKQYLPYPEVSNGGDFRTGDVSTATQQYYLDNYSSDFSGTPLEMVNAYTEVKLESSPSGRVLEQAAPGSDWTLGGGNTITTSYQRNEAGEVKQYDFDDLQEFGYYAAGELTKNTIVDEDENHTTTYTDKEGKTILKKSYTGSEWAETYYIYDELNRLRIVLSPESQKDVNDYYEDLDGYEVKTIDDFITSSTSGVNWAYTSGTSVTISPSSSGTTIVGPSSHIRPIETLNSGFLEVWAFQYDYDERNRMVMKQVPGAEPVYMVYDQWNRLVLTQNGEQRKANRWLYTAYDELNRPVMTGFITDVSRTSQSSMQDHVMSFGAANRALSYTGIGTSGYDDNAFPFAAGSDVTLEEVLTVTFYDNYDFVQDLSSLDLRYTNYQDVYEADGVFHIDPEKNPNVKGQVTGKLVYDGDSDFIESITYYDDRYRPIQIVSTNHLGGSDKVSYQYDFVGKIRKSETEHSNGSQTTFVRREFSYDHMDRLTEVTHQVNEEASITLLKNHYNALGERKRKDLHYAGANANPTQGDFEQNVDYTYNVRGWLKSINNPTLSGNDLFGMELFYNTSSGLSGHENRFNGNISAMRWSDYDADNEGFDHRAYEFDYDGLNRLTDANHFRNNVSHSEFSMEVSQYDLNGNIKNLSRKGDAGANMDNLSYSYIGNRLQKVDDSWDDSSGFKESGSGTDYTYDDNGNIISDANKGIVDIEYNHLNLPIKVTFDANNYITYLYNAAGMKLQQQIVEEGALLKITDYVGEFIYEDGGLALIHQEEGRVVPKGSGWDYQYHLKDHLGNVRLTFSTTPEEYSQTATFEDGNAVSESDFFGNYDPRHAHPAGGKGVRLNNATPAGPFVVLSVNKGDEVDLSVDGYYSGGSGYASPIAASALDDALSQAVQGAPVLDGIAGSAIDSGIGAAIAAMGVGGSSNDNIPGAYLTYMIFDRDMNYQDIYGYVQIGSAANGSRQTIQLNNIPIEGDGYLVAYLSNESNSSSYVYFDNFKVDHSKTNIVSSQDYYPFGLAFNSYTRTSSIPQSFKYNQGTGKKTFQGVDGKFYRTERVSELGIDMTKFRMYDYAIGRFLNVDPLADFAPQESWTPYQYAFNNPFRYNDPYGDCPSCVGAILGILTEATAQIGYNMFVNKQSFKEALDNIDGSDIAVAGAVGAITGFLDGGATNFVKFISKGRNRKVLKKLVQKGIEVIAETAENVAKDYFNDGSFDFAASIAGALTEVGLGSLAPSSKFINRKVNNSGKTIDRLQKKVDKGKTLTKRQSRSLESAKKTNKLFKVLQSKGNVPAGAAAENGGNFIGDKVTILEEVVITPDDGGE